MKLKEKPEDFVVEEVPSFSLTSKGDYGMYMLEKKLENTEYAVREIAKKLRLDRRRISYSGAKDRHAVTRQHISIHNYFEKEDVSFGNITIKYIGRSQKPLSLGSHLGNTFEIIVRECETEPKSIRKMINHFGSQRFSENNAEIGRQLVKRNFKEAAELVDDNRVGEALERNPNDYIGALKRLPKKTAMFYVHAYQSLLWNEAAEKLKNDFSENIHIPIIGFRTEFKDAKIRDAYEKIMEKEQIKPKDFVIRQWPEMSSEGSMRDLYVELEDMDIEKLDENTYRLEFFLPKGSYATVAIKQIFSQ